MRAWRTVGAIATIVIATIAACAASAGASLPAPATYNFTGSEQSYVVPAGVTMVHVVAVAGKGAGGQPNGSLAGGAGGFGADVSADLPVTAGQTLYVEVGGNASGAGPASNGGGTGGGPEVGGGGGGASDVRTCHIGATCSGTDSLASRLVVAGGGGGGGAAGIFDPGADGGSGASAGHDSATSVLPCSGSGVPMTQGGGSGTPSSGGPGGAGSCAGGNGADGGFGAGGAGGTQDLAGGGGGGGGWLGGGGGGGSDTSSGASGAGGGGGSDFT